MRPLWRSKTFWLNVGAAVLALMNGGDGAVPPDLLAGVTACANVAMRLATHGSVSVAGGGA